MSKQIRNVVIFLSLKCHKNLLISISESRKICGRSEQYYYLKPKLLKESFAATEKVAGRPCSTATNVAQLADAPTGGPSETS